MLASVVGRDVKLYDVLCNTTFKLERRLAMRIIAVIRKKLGIR